MLVYHDRVASEHIPVCLDGRLVVSGVALVAAASGVGVIVNSLLATFGNLWPDPACAHCSWGRHQFARGWRAAVVVGLETRPAGRTGGSVGRSPDLLDRGVRPKRGVGAHQTVGARISIVRIALADQTGGELIDRVRAPLGLFVATPWSPPTISACGGTTNRRWPKCPGEPHHRPGDLGGGRGCRSTEADHPGAHRRRRYCLAAGRDGAISSTAAGRRRNHRVGWTGARPLHRCSGRG